MARNGMGTNEDALRYHLGGSRWTTVMESRLTGEMGMERVQGVSQLFLKRDDAGIILLLLAKVTHEIMFAGSLQSITGFVERIK